ncbi:MAG: tyrosine-protein phosphatase [Bacteroidales bacterium]|nr:tyrosine-protein phosphatase [Bacteroidales bacterium]
MKFRYFLLALVIPAMMVCCTKPENNNNENEDPGNTNVDPGNNNGTTTEEEELNPEVKNGDKICVTNANVQKFLTDIHYEAHTASQYSKLRDWAAENEVTVCPGNSDRPPVYNIRWSKDAGDVKLTLVEPTQTRVYEVPADTYYQDLYNLLPNTTYTYEVANAGGNVISSGTFETYGLCHQLFFRTNVRNFRDLGGWKTTDGKTVKYRMVYRSGRLEAGKLSKSGKKDLVTEGLKAQLDLRGHSDVLKESTLKGIVDDYAFCAPVVEEGYAQMLNDDKEKTRQCMQFIFDCVDANKPVDFHCSLGRDRTGTVAMLCLGILGVDEGDISQEYELTQFAPHGYATSDGEKSKMVRTVDYKGAANVIWNLVDESKGESFKDGVEKYLLSIGITQADIDKFRANMLVD